MTRLPRQSRRAGPGRRWLEGRSLATLSPASLGALLAPWRRRAHGGNPPGSARTSRSRALDLRRRALRRLRLGADDLSAEDNDSFVNIFVRDLQANTDHAGQPGERRRGAAADLWSERPRSPPTGASSPSSRSPTTSAPRTDDLANIFVRDLQANTTTLVSRASGARGGRGTAARTRPRSPPTGASSPSARSPRTSTPDDGDTSRTCSCATCRRTRPRSSAGPAAPGRHGDGYSVSPVDLRRRALRRLHLCLTTSAADGDASADIFVRDLQAEHDHARQPGRAAPGAPADTRLPRALDLRRRALRRLRVAARTT